jgi:hypothetical protein
MVGKSVTATLGESFFDLSNFATVIVEPVWSRVAISSTASTASTHQEHQGAKNRTSLALSASEFKNSKNCEPTTTSPSLCGR